MTVEQILALGIDAVVDTRRNRLDKWAKITTLEWIRPRLEDHRAILYVEQAEDGSDFWFPADRSKSRRFKNTSQDSAVGTQ